MLQHQIFNPNAVSPNPEQTGAWEAPFLPAVVFTLPCNTWTLITYPWIFVMPTTSPNADYGTVFLAGGTQDRTTWKMDLDANPRSWQCVAMSNVVGSSNGSAVIYQRDPPDGSIEVLKCGGTGTPADVIMQYTERINLSSASPTWQPLADMNHVRIDHNLVALPNSRLAVFGGMDSIAESCFLFGGCAVQTPEWIDPNDPLGPEWTELAVMTSDRGHHSTALLLLDATVFQGGGEGVSAHTAEIFKPPYLFHANADISEDPAFRPVISTAPAIINYGRDFPVTLGANPPQPHTKVTLVRLGAPTHAFDQNQRLLSLQFQVVSDPTRLTVTAPANASLAPPGYYMLFVVSGSTATGGGVPSKGRYVLLR